MDWNTAIPPAPDVSITAHVLDYPDHTNPNMAGIITIRNYLPPVACGSGPSTCNLSPDPAAAPPYLIVRDVVSGCAYEASWLQTHGVLYTGAQLNCVPPPPPAQPPAGCNALISNTDPSGTYQAPAPNWLDAVQNGLHTLNANITPENCWADAGPNLVPTPSFPNEVPWTRSPEWLGTPGPDDSYIGGTVPAGAVPTGKVIRFQFQLPVMPNTPCPSPYGCNLTGNEQLRYMSLTFGYQPTRPANLDQAYIADVDGVKSDSGIPAVTTSLVSLADSAFDVTTDPASGNKYATLLVTLDGSLPGWLTLPSGTGRANGVGAGWHISGGSTVWSVAGCDGTYAVWWVDPPAGGHYTVLDLSKFTTCSRWGVASFKPTTMPLLMTIRNTLPNLQLTPPFNCSGAAVPFSTAEYTSAGGLMGPYVPQVDYWLPPSMAPQTTGVPTGLPPASACGTLPSGIIPGPICPNGPNCPTTTSQLNWPEAYWPYLHHPNPFALNCSTTTPMPQMNFVATQFPTPITAWATANGQDCTLPISNQSNHCSQIVLQAAQTTELPQQQSGTPVIYWNPGTPITIVGTNFGYLPSGSLPLAAAGSPNLLISHCLSTSKPCTSSTYDWDTNNPNCQVYIANWTDSSITVIPGLLQPQQDMYQLHDENPSPFLSLLTDASPLTFPAATYTTPGSCLVAAGDTFTFTVTNPQGGAPVTSPAISVSSLTGTVLH